MKSTSFTENINTQIGYLSKHNVIKVKKGESKICSTPDIQQAATRREQIVKSSMLD